MKTGGEPIHHPAPTQANGVTARQLALRLVVGLALLIVAMAVAAQYYRVELLALSQAFVQTWGGLGVAMAFFWTDALPIPVPPDPAAAFGLIGGMSFFGVWLWGVAGSLSGGIVGFALGRALHGTAFFSRLVSGSGAKAFEIVERYGVYGVAAAALTPLPYCVASWAAGSLRMPFWRFLLISQLRLVRVAFYLMLIHIGATSFLG